MPDQPARTGPALSARVSALKPSVTVAVTNRAKQLRADGLDVLSFAAGEPDFDTPDRIKQAAMDAMRAGQTKYMPTLGDHETRDTIAHKLTAENGIEGLSGSHVAITCGGKHALYNLIHCLMDPPAPGHGPDEALLPVPAWVSYAPIVKLAGGRVVELDTSAESDFKINAEQLRRAITPRSRLLILNTPSNPCGTMYSEPELRALAAVVHESRDVAPGLLVLVDEMYEKIVYGGIPHFSIGSVPEIADRVVTLNGLSKAYAMTGWRAGYAAMPGDFGSTLIKAMGTLQGQMTTNIAAFIYPAIRAALTECAEEVETMRAAFAQRATLVAELLGAMPKLSVPTPTGAFYAFPKVSEHFGSTTAGGRTIRSALDFAEALLDEKQVAVVPGEDFGGRGGEHVRISFACSEDQIRRGMDRLDSFLRELS